MYRHRHLCMQHSEFNEEYLKHLSEKLNDENKKVVLLGDFNIDLLKFDSNKNVFEIIYYTNFLSNITFPARLKL